MKRRCSTCGDEFPLDADHFYRLGVGFQYNCKTCSGRVRRAWRRANRSRDALHRKLLRAGLGVRAERRREGWSEGGWASGDAAA